MHIAFTDGLFDDEEDAANAHLIAAAPDMYEQLVRCRDIFRPDSEGWRNINDVIAKAEGRS